MTRCPRCYSTDLVGFELAPKGQTLTFTHCRSCEHRWWIGGGADDSVALGDVLHHIAA